MIKEEKGITPYPWQAGLSLISGYLEARHKCQSTKLKGHKLHLKDVRDWFPYPLRCPEPL